jgi:23S rRNA-/tRNA-specific pseudouridylate synthase
MGDPPEIRTVHRDEDLLIVVKPAGLSTTSPDGPSLASRVVALDPMAPRLHPTSRLDAEVTGLVTFARTRTATKALLQARREGAYRRLYLALATGSIGGEGIWRSPIARDPADPRRRVVKDGGVPAETVYRVVATAGPLVLLALFPRTGRTHQLRVHASAAGAPLFGDVHYGGERRATTADGRVITAKRVMLHCAALELPPIARRKAALSVTEPPPEDFARVWQKAGGDRARIDARLARPFEP